MESLRCILGNISVRVLETTSPDDVVHLYSALGLLVVLHTTERYLPSTTDMLFCDDVLNVGRSTSKNEISKNHSTFYYRHQIVSKVTKACSSQAENVHID